MSKNKNAPLLLEEALQQTEADADASLKTAAAVSRSLKRLRTVVHEGNLRDVHAALSSAEQSVEALHQQVTRTVQGWDFDEASYFSSGAYVDELLTTAARMQVTIFEQDDRLYCYPSLVRVLPSERALLIDRTRERRLRPSAVVDHLRTLQDRPARFRPDAFLEALFKAYRTLVQRHGSGKLESAPVERLARVYELLTLLPGQSREYSSHEFARDIYLLDRSGIMKHETALWSAFLRAPGRSPRVALSPPSRKTGRSAGTGVSRSREPDRIHSTHDSRGVANHRRERVPGLVCARRRRSGKVRGGQHRRG